MSSAYLDADFLKNLENIINIKENVFYLKVIIKEDAILKNARFYQIYLTLSRKFDILYIYPSLQLLTQESNIDIDNLQLIFYSPYDYKQTESICQNLSDLEKIELVKLTKDYKLDSLLNIPFISITKKNIDFPQSKVKVEDDFYEVKFIKVPIESLDLFLILLGEIIQAKNSLNSYHDIFSNISSELMKFSKEYRLRCPISGKSIENYLDKVKDILLTLNRITEQLRVEINRTRLMPLDIIFSHLPRIVRDISKNLNKKVKLEVVGGNIEIDRSILEFIREPIIHIIRNCIDHGIESEDERLKSNKTPAGLIKVSAYALGNFVNIEISDDGKGIDIEKIKEKAIKLKYITKQEANSMKKEELINLIFIEGFSTSEKVTSVSGRGIGMDIVKNNLRKIGGFLHIDTQEGKGSKFILQVPLTIAIIDGIIFREMNRYFVLPVSVTKSIKLMNFKDFSFSKGIVFVRFEDKYIPIFHIFQLYNKDFDLKDYLQKMQKIYMFILNVGGGKEIGLITSNIIDKEEIVVKDLGGIKVDGFLGSCILKNGYLGLILDVSSFYRVLTIKKERKV